MSEKEKATLEIIKNIMITKIYRDCLIIASFTILAIAFQRWWISLFSILVIFIVRTIDAVEVKKDE